MGHEAFPAAGSAGLFHRCGINAMELVSVAFFCCLLRKEAVFGVYDALIRCSAVCVAAKPTAPISCIMYRHRKRMHLLWLCFLLPDCLYCIKFHHESGEFAVVISLTFLP